MLPGTGSTLLRISHGISGLPIRWTLAGAVWLAIASLVYLSLAWV
jgi:hypothetical protein